MYKIECEVYGGVTGHRVGWMKYNGVDIEFVTEVEARRHVPPSQTNARGVVFNYRVVKVS